MCYKNGTVAVVGARCQQNVQKMVGVNMAVLYTLDKSFFWEHCIFKKILAIYCNIKLNKTLPGAVTGGDSWWLLTKMLQMHTWGERLVLTK